MCEDKKKAGFIKLYRGLLDWEFYDDHNTTRLFVHLLIRANYRDKKWQGIIVKKGSLVTSLQQLSLETGLTEQQIRTALTKLEKCQSINKQTTNRFTLLTIENYCIFQDENSNNSEELTTNQQTNNKQITTTKERKEGKNIKSLLKEKIDKKEKSTEESAEELTEDFFTSPASSKNNYFTDSEDIEVGIIDTRLSSEANSDQAEVVEYENSLGVIDASKKAIKTKNKLRPHSFEHSQYNQDTIPSEFIEVTNQPSLVNKGYDMDYLAAMYDGFKTYYTNNGKGIKTTYMDWKKAFADWLRRDFNNGQRSFNKKNRSQEIRDFNARLFGVNSWDNEEN